MFTNFGHIDFAKMSLLDSFVAFKSFFFRKNFGVEMLLQVVSISFDFLKNTQYRACQFFDF